MIYLDDKNIIVGGIILPGIIISTEIDADILYDEIEVEGRTDKPKQVTGYADAKIFIDISLHGETKEELNTKLFTIQRMFRKPNQSTPTVYTIVNEHVNLRDVSKVIFKKLTTSVPKGKENEIIANLEFMEYIPITITAKKATATTSTSAASSGSTTLNQDYQIYLDNSRGTAPKIPSKAAASPAIDVADRAKPFLTDWRNRF
jgi:hypothetical protein